MLFCSLKNVSHSIPDSLIHFGIELRFDLFETIDFEEIQKMQKENNRPFLFTFRKRVDRKIMEALLELKPSYSDIESEEDADLIEKYPDTKFIFSYHHWIDEEIDLEKLFLSMQRVKAIYYKIAFTPRSTIEAISSLLWAKEKKNLILICMGEKFQFARILAAHFNQPFSYCAVDEKEKTAPGQLSFNEMIFLYDYPNLSRKKIFGLIGDPVEKSQGDLYHNRFFLQEKIDAFYLKFLVHEEELSSFLVLAKKIGIVGLSVTMPLKEKIVSYVDEIEGDFPYSLNTLFFDKDQLIGTNTDGIAALDVIEERLIVKGKKVLILGAGGTSFSIAHEAKKRGAKLYIWNRNRKRAENLAKIIGCDLAENLVDYDLLIQTTPTMPISAENIIAGRFFFDVLYAGSLFSEEVIQRGGFLIEGKKMFEKQAQQQQQFWMKKWLLQSSV